MNRKAANALLALAFATVLLSAACTASAGASPLWKFEGLELKGAETIVGGATESSLSTPGLSITCDYSYGMKVRNVAGSATGEMTELAISNCSTSATECSVELATAETLPWALSGIAIKSSTYVVLKGIKMGFLFAGPLCPLDETWVTVKGTAGGKFDNSSHTFSFDAASFGATGTKLTALGATFQWDGVFSTEATGPNSGLGLTL